VETGRRDDWDQLGVTDPLWAILSDPAKRGGRWDAAEFFASGEEDVVSLMAAAGRLGRPVRREAALDFGCGVGRVTRALGARFEKVLGVDISGSMVRQAREYCASVSNVSFAVADARVLATFESGGFDLVYSRWVLQHLEDEAAIRNAVRGLARVVRPGGLLAIQLPARYPLRHRIQARRRAYGLLRRLGISPALLLGRLGLSPIRMSGIEQAEVRRILERSGLVVVEVQADLVGGSSIDSFTYYATTSERDVSDRLDPTS
jgi:SAM-dependent methyltransferase